MTPFQNDHPDRILDVTPKWGVEVHECIFHALAVVRTIGGRVRFVHNGAEVIVDSETPYYDILKQWKDNIK